jgi:hypothetical protein
VLKGVVDQWHFRPILRQHPSRDVLHPERSAVRCCPAMCLGTRRRCYRRYRRRYCDLPASRCGAVVVEAETSVKAVGMKSMVEQWAHVAEIWGGAGVLYMHNDFTTTPPITIHIPSHRFTVSERIQVLSAPSGLKTPYSSFHHTSFVIRSFGRRLRGRASCLLPPESITRTGRSSLGHCSKRVQELAPGISPHDHIPLHPPLHSRAVLAFASTF